MGIVLGHNQVIFLSPIYIPVTIFITFCFVQDIRLKAGMALTIFAFNNTPKQFSIREAGGMKFSVFEMFINSKDETDQCYAAFQVKRIVTLKFS